jgi:hypothetical protein
VRLFPVKLTTTNGAEGGMLLMSAFAMLDRWLLSKYLQYNKVNTIDIDIMQVLVYQDKHSSNKLCMVRTYSSSRADRLLNNPAGKILIWLF